MAKLSKATKSRVKLPKGNVLPTGQTRFKLAYPAVTRMAAKGKTTKLINRGLNTSMPKRKPGTAQSGDNLKNGILGMATRANVTQEQWDKLEAMDPDDLEVMYDNNDLVFEVFFQYEGINYHDDMGVFTIEKNKLSDIDFLIGEYDRLFPKG